MAKSLIGLYILIVILPPSALAIVCYICGQTNLQPPGECTTQFQFDCSAMLNNGGSKASKQLCRTTRSRIGENLYSVGKECISEHDHATRYPNGRNLGCETMDKSGVHELTYCLCDRDMCNLRNIDEQTVDYFGGNNNVSAGSNNFQHQPHWAIISSNNGVVANNNNNNNAPIVTVPPSGINLSISAGPFQARAGGDGATTTVVQGRSKLPVPAAFPTEIITVDPATSSSSATLPTFVSGDNDELSSPAGQRSTIAVANTDKSPILEFKPLRVTTAVESWKNGNNASAPSTAANTENPWQVQNVETHHVVVSTTNRETPRTFACLMCAETNLSINEECKEQVEVDCLKLVPGSTNMFCFTKVTRLSNDKQMVEKRCMTEESATNELGLSEIEDGCDEVNIPAMNFQYCLCSTSKCNNHTLFEQIGKAGGYLGNSGVQKSTTFFGIQQQINDKFVCYVCAETDLALNADCRNQYASDCTNGSIAMMCLTKRTKLPNGLFSMEKRCVSEMERHVNTYLQQVPLNGCNGATRNNNGSDEHACLCNESYCNKENIFPQLITTTVPATDNNPDTKKQAIGEASKSSGSLLITAQQTSTKLSPINSAVSSKPTLSGGNATVDHSQKMIKLASSTVAHQHLSNNRCNSLPNINRTLKLVWALVIITKVLFTAL